ncbi:MAG: AarF/ABC1/UbiB kinase family protein [Deltaproteobacteria bacterium]|nr:AarF/ABC1/UbiB kinase family protein [Deltaproteobacteria bacterium]
MADDREARKAGFLDLLRGESERGPGRGLGRFARLLGGGAGLARRMLRVGRGGADAEVSPRDLKKLEGLVRQLGDLKGLPMKFGQIVSYLELEMPEEMRGLLSLLQTQSPATPRAQVEQVVREDLGTRGATLWAGLDPEPVSIASIGQVYRGRLPDGAEVAVKVRHPAIDEAIRSDFRVASFVTVMAGAMAPGMGATARDFVDEMKARLLEECDYALEAERQRLFGRLYEGHPIVVVPRVHDGWCARRVLTTSWEEGRDFEPFRATATQEQRDRAGAALFDFYVGTLYRHGLFHADPHPGNYRFRDDGRVVIFDYGCVRIFEPEVATAFAALARAVREDDRGTICEALRGLGAEPSSNDKTYEHLRRLLRGFFGPLLTPGAHRIDGRIVIELGQVARDKLALARLRLPGRLVFLFRIRFGLFAVLSRLGAVNDWAALERRYFEEARRPCHPSRFAP